MPDTTVRAKDEDEKKHTRMQAAENELSFAIKEYPTIVCPALGSPDDFMKLDFFSKVRDIVKSEGPIHRDLLMKRLFECYGIKEGVRTKNRFDEVLDSHLPAPEVTIDGELYWAQEPKFMFNIRRSDAEIRPMNYIPLPEIRLAVLLVVSNGISISGEDIPKEVAAIFGAPKMSPKFKARVNLATEELIERKYLSEDSGKIIVNKDFQKTADESEKKEKEEGKKGKGKGDRPPKEEFEPHFRSKLPGGDDSSNVVFR